MNSLKKILAVILTVSMICSIAVFPVSAAAVPTIAVDSVTGDAGKTVSVNVNVAGNSGIKAMSVRVYYKSDILKCTAVENGEQWTSFVTAHVSDVIAGKTITMRSQPDDVSNISADRKTNGWKMASIGVLADVDGGYDQSGTVATLKFTIDGSLESCETPLEVEIVDNVIANGEGVNITPNTQNGKVTINGVIPTINTVTLASSETITVQGGTAAAQTVQATATSAKGTDISGNVSWTVEPAGKGVTISASGLVSVSAKAEAGNYQIKASALTGKSQGEAKTAPLTVARATSVASNIAVSNKTIAVPTAANTPSTVMFTATVTDQFDSTMEEAVTWSVDNATGVSIDTNGVVSVTNKASAGEVTVTAATASNLTYSATLTITKAAPVAETVTVTGDSTIAVPTAEVGVAKTAAYQAAITDQYDDPLNGNVTWSVSNAAGVSIGTDGIVSVTNKASAGDVTVTATTSNGKTATATLNIIKAEPEATVVKITRGGTELGATDTVVMPVAGGTDKSYEYGVNVYDQFGDAMTQTSANWIFSTADTYVTHEDGTVTVKDGARKDSTYTLTATVGSASASVTIKVTDLDVVWPDKVVDGEITYGETLRAHAAYPATGTASAADTELTGTFELVDADGRLYVSDTTAQLKFTVTSEGEYQGVTVLKDYEITVNPKNLTINDGTVKLTKEYDGTTAAGTLTGELGLTGIVGEDEVTIAVGVTAGMYPDSKYGTYTVTLSGITLTGADAANYTVANTYEFKNAKITKTVPTLEMLDVTVPAAHTYDNTAVVADIAAKSTIEGMGQITVKYQKGDTTATTAAPVNAGTYKVIASIAEGDNYAEVDLEVGEITINKAERDLTIANDTLELYPTALTDEVELTYNDLDKSAVVAYMLTGDTTAVSRKNMSFTAVGNGIVTVSITIPETENYQAAAAVTATVKALVQPILAVEVIDTVEGESLTAVVDGNTIVLSGIVNETSNADLYFYVPENIDIAFEIVLNEDGTYDITLGDETIMTYMLDATNVVVLAGDSNIKIADAEVLAEGTDIFDISDAAVAGLSSATAKTLIVEADTLGTAKVDEITAAVGTDFTVEVLVTVKLTVTEKTETNLKMEVVPVYQITAVSNQDPDNTFELKATSEIPASAITAPVGIAIPIPDGFVPTVAKHTNGTTVEYLPVYTENGVAAWQQSTFSEIELLADNRAGRVTFTFADGTVQTIAYTAADLDSKLPTDTKSGYSFTGWSIDGKTYTTLSDELLTAINGGTVTAEAQFNSYGGGGTVTKKPAEQTPFVFEDVSADSYYYEAVKWAVEKNITSGMTATTFGPDMACTRAQIVTFLWNSEGCPEPTGTTHPFTDVPAGAYYEKALLWAVENNIVSGITETAFAPDQVCTRAQAMTFLWRAAGRPSTGTNAGFQDVAGDSYYAEAVAWAVANKITSGTSATTFSPEVTCTRAQIVMFLYNELAK